MSPTESIDGFRSNYLFYEMVKNSPIIHTEKKFKTHYVTYQLGFHHSMQGQWLMGIGFGFKSWWKKDTNHEFSLASINHDSLYVIRLYHPTYFLVGPRIHYMIPTRQSTFPLIKDPNYEIEVGVALSMSIISHIKKDWMISARVDRWRGTKTNSFHGIETALGLHYAL